MGGSGGGGYFARRTPDEVKAELRKEEKRTANQAFDTDIAETLGDLLSDANDRDTKTTADALADVKKALEKEIEGSIDSSFGGSVRKRTYVEGLSDVDTLAILREPSLASQTPQSVLDYFEKRVRADLPDWEVSRGKLSITIRKDGAEIQILPAIKKGGTTKIPSARGDRWSDIKPEAFFRKLSETNTKYGGKVVPVIKLAKIINARQPESLQLSGYHLESLAIEAFKGYNGLLNPKAMLVHFVERSKVLVLAPIKDKTGQSVHVDDYLGPTNNASRKAVSAALDRIYRQMKNADVQRSRDMWLELVGES